MNIHFLHVDTTTAGTVFVTRAQLHAALALLAVDRYNEIRGNRHAARTHIGRKTVACYPWQMSISAGAAYALEEKKLITTRINPTIGSCGRLADSTERLRAALDHTVALRETTQRMAEFLLATQLEHEKDFHAP